MSSQPLTSSPQTNSIDPPPGATWAPRLQRMRTIHFSLAPYRSYNTALAIPPDCTLVQFTTLLQSAEQKARGRVAPIQGIHASFRDRLMTSDAHVAEVNDGEKILVWRAAVPFPGVEVVNELPPLDNDTLTLLNLGTEFLKKQNLNSRLYAEENLDILRREIRARRYGYQIDEDDYPAFKRVRIFDDEARQYAATHGNFGSDFPYRPDLKSVAQWMLGMIFTFLPQPHSTTIEIDAGLVQKAIDAKAEVNLACFYDSGNVFHPVDGIWRNVPRAMTTGRYGNVPKGQWTLLDLVTDVSLPHHRARG